MAYLNELHCTKRIQSRVFHLRRLHCLYSHPLSLSCRTDRKKDSGWIIFVPRKYKREGAMCPYNATNPLAYTAISTPNTNPHQISKHHTITNLASEQKRRKKNIHHAANTKRLQYAHGTHSEERAIPKVRPIKHEARYTRKKHY